MLYVCLADGNIPQVPGPGGEQPGAQVPRAPGVPGGPEPKSDKALLQLKQQIKSVAAQLGYVHGQKDGQPDPQEPGQSVSVATQGDQRKKEEGKPPTEDIKTDETDELGDFLSKSRFIQFLKILKRSNQRP